MIKFLYVYIVVHIWFVKGGYHAQMYTYVGGGGGIGKSPPLLKIFKFLKILPHQQTHNYLSDSQKKVGSAHYVMYLAKFNIFNFC